MKKEYHFITGLPRSGSTLLSSILLQNPDFHASISDCLFECTDQIIKNASAPQFKKMISIDRRKNMIKGLFDGFYEDVNKTTIFNTNRLWTYLSPLIADLYSNSKFIVCVRDINWILDSFEMAQRKNPYNTTSFGGNTSDSVYDRVSRLAEAGGLIMHPYHGIKQAMSSNEKHKLFFVEYNDLCITPEQTMKRLYEFIEKDYFNHDFNDVERSWDEYDVELGADLHKVRKDIQYIERESILTPDILYQYANMEFWR